MSEEATRDLSEAAAEGAARAQRSHEQLADSIKPFIHPDFFFVNIGANDGVTKDPIYRFLIDNQWQGIAVEPVPYVFERLEANLADVAPQVALVNAAIGDTPRQMWTTREHEGSFWDITTQIASFDRDLALENLEWLASFANRVGVAAPQEGLGEELVALDVECIRFNDLMREHGVDHVDLLNIDAEGADFDIFQSIDLDRYCPNVACIELSAMSKSERSEVRRRLGERGLRVAHGYGPFTAVFVRQSDPG